MYPNIRRGKGGGGGGLGVCVGQSRRKASTNTLEVSGPEFAWQNEFLFPIYPSILTLGPTLSAVK
jgi:hypothetical protein